MFLALMLLLSNFALMAQPPQDIFGCPRIALDGDWYETGSDRVLDFEVQGEKVGGKFIKDNITYRIRERDVPDDIFKPLKFQSRNPDSQATFDIEVHFVQNCKRIRAMITSYEDRPRSLKWQDFYLRKWELDPIPHP